ncbi:MAG: hypothetical protein M1825_006366 [Sarcosagium campestre]|nr:MAG: hypothetical protein M1825_006366 [Sarcosagium campestre]
MGRSLASESGRPILAAERAKRASHRVSTYSGAPSVQSDSTVHSSGSDEGRYTDIHDLSDGLARLEQKRLQQQRYVPSSEKTESLSQLALQAKLERALGRRLTGQDAVLRPKVRSEKPHVDYSRTTSAPA